MSGIRSLLRSATIIGFASAASAPIYVNSTDNKLKVIPTGTGTTEVEVFTQAALAVITGDGAIPVAQGTTVLTKGSAAAITLAAPTAAQNGMMLEIVAGSAFAHVVTATGLIDDGVTGGAKTTLTFGAFVGATITLMAYNLHWVVVSKNVVTVS